MRLTLFQNMNTPCRVKDADIGQNLDTSFPQSDSVTKRQILEKLFKRMNELENGGVPEACSELNPDVIVISADQSLLLEPQNQRASELLQRRCGLGMERVQVRERIRVHPFVSRRIIADLKAAGLKVV
jgi:hypothetical protein